MDIKERFRYEVVGLDELKAALRQVAKQSNMTEKEIDEMFSKVEKGSKQSTQSTQRVNTGMSGLGSVAGKAGAAMVAAFAVDKVLAYGKQILDLERKYTSLEKQIARFSGLQGTALDKATSKVDALATTFDKDVNEVLISANNFSQQMGISFDEALTLMEKGFLNGADASGDFLTKVKEYPIQFKNAGFSAEEFIKLTTQEIKGGIYDDKLIDSIKELGLSIREMDKAQIDALTNAFGQSFTQKFVQDVNTGKLSVEDAFFQIATKAKSAGLTVQQTQKLTADVFKGAGEDAGGFVEILKQIDEAYKINLDALDDYGKSQKESLELEKELSEQKQELAENIGGVSKAFDKLVNQIQTSVISSINSLFDRLFFTDKLIKDMQKNTTDIISRKSISEITIEIENTQNSISKLEDKIKKTDGSFDGLKKTANGVGAVLSTMSSVPFIPEVTKGDLEKSLEAQKHRLSQLQKSLSDLQETGLETYLSDVDKAFNNVATTGQNTAKKLTDEQKKAFAERKQRELKASRELAILKLEAEVAYNERRIEEEKTTLNEQLELNIANKDKQLQILQLQYENELEGAKLTKTEKLVIDEEYKQKRNDILRESTEYQLKLWQDELDANKVKNEKMAADQRQFQQEELSLNYELANAMLVENLVKGEITEKDFYKRRKSLVKENLQAEIELLYEQFKTVELGSEEEIRILEQLNEKRKQLREEDLQDFLSTEQQKQEARQAAVEVGISIANSLIEITSELREREISQLEAQKEYELRVAGENADAKVRIEENYNRKIAAQKQRQAQNEKLLGIANVVINTASAIMKAGSQLGAYALPIQIAIGVQGAAQAALIAAQQLPKFNKGIESVPGDGNTDTVHAMLTPGERVMTKEQNAALKGISNQQVVEMVEFAMAMRGANNGGFDNKAFKEAVREAVFEGFANQTTYNTTWTEKGVERSVTKGIHQTIILNSENR